MKVIGALVYAVAVLVNSIDCYNPQGIWFNKPLEVVRMRARDLPGVWSFYVKQHGVRGNMYHPVQDYLDVVLAGNTIIGRAEDHTFYPVYDSTAPRNCIIMEYGQPARKPKIVNWDYYHTRGLDLFDTLPNDTIYRETLTGLESPSSPRAIHINRKR